MGKGLDQQDVTRRRHGPGLGQDRLIIDRVVNMLKPGQAKIGQDIELNINDQGLQAAMLMRVNANLDRHMQAAHNHL